jgi:hypothetical protein
MAWFRWKAKQDPWGDNFSIALALLPPTAIGVEPTYTVPFDQHVQLISAQISLNPGVLPPTMFVFLRASRGDHTLYRNRVPIPGGVVGIARTSGGVTLRGLQDRNSLHWGTFGISDYFYLYPGDVITIGVTHGGGATWTLLNCCLTFKQWITG